MKILNKKINMNTRLTISLILIFLLLITSIFFGIQNKNVKQTVSNMYDKAFYELVEYVDNVETLLAKAQITTSPEYSAKTLSNIWRKADLAQASISQIPTENNTLNNAIKFFNQLSDYSYSLSNKLIDGNKLSDEDFSNLRSYYEACKTLNMTLKGLSSDLSSNSISWEELTEEKNNSYLAQEVANISKNSFSQIEEDMQDYEGLIYDGPFSEHMTTTTPLGLGSGEYSEEQALEKLYEYIPKEQIFEIKNSGLVSGDLPSYSFEFKMTNGSVGYINITKQGGNVLFINIYRNINEENISLDDANSYAKKFLNEHGFTNMQETYFTNENGVITINYAYNQDGILCYTDLIKVKVALDNGEILGLETKSYLYSHHDREMPAAHISMQDAQSKINPSLEIFSSRTAVIPTDWKTELTAYEFKGKLADQYFIVYINIENGKEEKIFMLLETPNGTLAI